MKRKDFEEGSEFTILGISGSFRYREPFLLMKNGSHYNYHSQVDIIGDRYITLTTVFLGESISRNIRLIQCIPLSRDKQTFYPTVKGYLKEEPDGKIVFVEDPFGNIDVMKFPKL